jgi:uncharacterized protein YbcV (DUF1398 family)
MAEVQKQDRLVRESFVTRILERLRDWLPVTKNNTTVNFITPGEETKNAISIYANGEIHIITDLQNNTVESLQSRLSTIGLTVCKNETEFLQLISKQNIGKFVYLEEGAETYKAGLYSFLKNLSDRGECLPYYIGIDIKEDLKKYYTKEECNAYIENYITNLKIPTDKTIEQVVIEQIKGVKLVVSKKESDN